MNKTNYNILLIIIMSFVGICITSLSNEIETYILIFLLNFVVFLIFNVCFKDEEDK